MTVELPAPLVLGVVVVVVAVVVVVVVAVLSNPQDPPYLLSRESGRVLQVNWLRSLAV